MAGGFKWGSTGVCSIIWMQGGKVLITFGDDTTLGRVATILEDG